MKSCEVLHNIYDCVPVKTSAADAIGQKVNPWFAITDLVPLRILVLFQPSCVSIFLHPPAWTGFLSDLFNEINALFGRLHRFGYQDEIITINDLMCKYSYKPFSADL